jgi:hypothetical protein
MKEQFLGTQLCSLLDILTYLPLKKVMKRLSYAALFLFVGFVAIILISYDGKENIRFTAKITFLNSKRYEDSSPKIAIIESSTPCKGTLSDKLNFLLDKLVRSGLQLVLTQSQDLVIEKDFVKSKFLNIDEPVTRLGVLGENLILFESTVEKILRYCPSI